MIKMVGFDLDGTIGNTLPMCIRAFQQAVTPYTQRQLSEKEIIQTFGLNEEGMIKRIVTNDYWEKALNDFYVIYKKEHISCPHPFDGIIELIRELKVKSISTVLITGKGEKSCSITLKQFGMDTCFDKIETGSPEKNRKSEAIKDLLVKTKLRFEEMVYIGDTVADIEACNEVGIKCLSAGWGASFKTVRQLEICNKGYVFYTIKSLRDYLMKNIYSD